MRSYRDHNLFMKYKSISKLASELVDQYANSHWNGGAGVVSSYAFGVEKGSFFSVKLM